LNTDEVDDRAASIICSYLQVAQHLKLIIPGMKVRSGRLSSFKVKLNLIASYQEYLNRALIKLVTQQ